jgi:hypothetical protein
LENFGAPIWGESNGQHEVGMQRKPLPKERITLMKKNGLWSWLMLMAFGLALIAPQSAFSQGCG